MLIENIDALKVWLVATLEPICDADPAALAKYVIALAKKDKPTVELRALCEDQLDVFLGDETKVFVGNLFTTLQTKAYMPQGLELPVVADIKTENAEEAKGTKRKTFEESEERTEKITDANNKVVKTEEKPDVGKTLENDKENNAVQKQSKKDAGYESSPELHSSKGGVEKSSGGGCKEKPLRMSTRQSVKKEPVDDQDVDNVSMRSASIDRSAKSMSPAVRTTRHGHSSSSRRKSSRSPTRSGGRHTRTSRRDRTRRSSRERSSRDQKTSRRKDKDKEKEKEKDKEKEKEKEKCRDYEEKGFCMLGEVCPYDHGYDPVEVDDTNLPQMLTLAGLPTSQPQPPQLPGPPPMHPFPNVIPARPALVGPPMRPSLNTGLTTVQVRPIPSPAELPRHQVPIFRPRNPIAFMQRNLSPPSVPPVNPIAQIIRPMRLPPAKTTDDLPKPPGQNAYNPEEPSIEVGVANSIKNAMKTQSLPNVKAKVNDGGSRKKVSSALDEDNRTQDELVQIAMGNVPLTPIVGSQPANIFNPNSSLNSNILNSQPQQMPAARIVLPNPNRAVLLQQQPPMQPMALTVQQQYHQLQIQQQQQAAAMIAQQQQQQQQLQQQQQQQQQQHQQQHHQQHHLQPAAVHSKPYRKNTVLELQKIPAHLNNIVRLSEFFQKFGIITRVQTPYNNDNQAALIEFSQYQEAVSAYNCPDAVLGNRFIKMFWHNPNKPKAAGPLRGANVPAVTTLHPEGGHHGGHAVGGSRPPRKIPSMEEMTYTNPKTDPKVMQAEKKKELNKLKLELLKKKQTHYEELSKKQKEILSKLEKENITKEEKARLLKAFKHADVAVQKLKKELYEEVKPKVKAEPKPAPAPSKPVQNIADATKAILDKEIDIYHGKLDGEELIEAKKDLANLKRQANFTSSSTFTSSPNFTSSPHYTSPVPRGRGSGFRGRGRSSWYQRGGGARGGRSSFCQFYATLNIDNRPKQILVSGYDLAQKDDVVAHFAKFGQLDRIEEHENNSMKLTFPTRKSAELAAEQGATFQGKQLVLSWFTPQQHQVQTPAIKVEETATLPVVERTVTTRSLSQSLMDKDLDDDLLELDKDEEEMLLADVEDDDDEDDVESEVRSWRR